MHQALHYIQQQNFNEDMAYIMFIIVQTLLVYLNILNIGHFFKASVLQLRRFQKSQCTTF